jgi:hypothetical protein
MFIPHLTVHIPNSDWEREYPEKVIGFRLDGIRENGTIGFYGAPESEAQRIGNRPAWELDRWAPHAFCVTHDHIAPYRGCKCGWYVTTDMQQLSEYTTPGYGLDVSLQTVDRIQHRSVVVEVTAHGPKMRPGRSDPDSSFRATWVSLNGRCWIRDDVPEETVVRTKNRYPFLRIERFGDLSEVPEMAERSKDSSLISEPELITQCAEWTRI